MDKLTVYFETEISEIRTEFVDFFMDSLQDFRSKKIMCTETFPMVPTST
jgi:hypothetical protein